MADYGVNKPKSEMTVREAASKELGRSETQPGAPDSGATEEASSERIWGWTDTADEMQALVDRIFSLPFGAQLGILRTLAPQIIACIEGEEREGFVRDLNEEIERAVRGERTYDIRPNPPSVH